MLAWKASSNGQINLRIFLSAEKRRNLIAVNDIIFKDGLDAMDFNKVTSMLSQSYWSPGVYSRLGFKVISRPLDWMEIRRDRSKR